MFKKKVPLQTGSSQLLCVTTVYHHCPSRHRHLHTCSYLCLCSSLYLDCICTPNSHFPPHIIADEKDEETFLKAVLYLTEGRGMGILETITFYLWQWCHRRLHAFLKIIIAAETPSMAKCAKNLMGNNYWGEVDFPTPKYAFWRNILSWLFLRNKIQEKKKVWPSP